MHMGVGIGDRDGTVRGVKRGREGELLQLELPQKYFEIFEDVVAKFKLK